MARIEFFRGGLGSVVCVLNCFSCKQRGVAAENFGVICDYLSARASLLNNWPMSSSLERLSSFASSVIVSRIAWASLPKPSPETALCWERHRQEQHRKKFRNTFECQHASPSGNHSLLLELSFQPLDDGGIDRKSVVLGKGVSVRLDRGGRRHIK